MLDILELEQLTEACEIELQSFAPDKKERAQIVVDGVKNLLHAIKNPGD